MENKIIKIGDDEIGENYPCYIIAEIGINHNGKLELAKKLVDAAVESGANAVKFQKRSLKDLYRTDVLKDPNIESQGLEILIQVLNEVELKNSDYEELVKYCRDKKITFLCTPWDKTSVDFLTRFNLPAYKISSADMTNFPLLKYVSKTKSPLIVSTGMSTIDEIEKTVYFLKKQKIDFILLHCNSTYPAPLDTLNLKFMNILHSKFDVPIGYSGHESGIIGTLTAVNMGAVIVERHITLDKTMDGLDQSSSLNPVEFKTLVKNIRESEITKGNPIKKMTRGEILQKEVLAKSIVCISDINIDEIFSEKNIDVRGPSKGLSPQYFYELLGKKSKRKIKKDEYIQSEDL